MVRNSSSELMMPTTNPMRHTEMLMVFWVRYGFRPTDTMELTALSTMVGMRKYFRYPLYLWYSCL